VNDRSGNSTGTSEVKIRTDTAMCFYIVCNKYDIIFDKIVVVFVIFVFFGKFSVVFGCFW